MQALENLGALLGHSFGQFLAAWLLLNIIVALITILVPFLVGYWLGGRRYRKMIKEGYLHPLLDEPRRGKFTRSLDAPRL
jgi:hypothetical protein